MNITRLMWIVTFVTIGPGTVLGAQPLRPAADVAAPTAKFTLNMTSDNDDFVGSGEQYTYKETDTDSFFINIFDRDPDGQPDYVEIIFHQGIGQFEGDFWSITIGTNQLGTPLAPGTYENATRAAFAEPGTPGLDIGLNGRGCNTVTGRFTITAIEFDCMADAAGDPVAHLKRLELEFEQHCEGAQAALRGTLSLVDDGGFACAGGTPGTPQPPPPPPLVRVNVPAEILEQGIILENDAATSFEISTSTLESFEGDVHLSVVRNGTEAHGLDLRVEPEFIPAPGVGTATVHVTSGPMTFPREYLVNILATIADGRIYSSPTIYVNLFCDPPMILGLDQPRGVTVNHGEAATLSARSLGSGPLRYQWYRGPRRSTNFPVADADRATLSLSSVTESQPYWVRVSNACGSTDSQVAFVDVR